MFALSGADGETIRRAEAEEVGVIGAAIRLRLHRAAHDTPEIITRQIPALRRLGDAGQGEDKGAAESGVVKADALPEFQGLDVALLILKTAHDIEHGDAVHGAELREFAFGKAEAVDVREDGGDAEEHALSKIEDLCVHTGLCSPAHGLAHAARTQGEPEMAEAGFECGAAFHH